MRKTKELDKRVVDLEEKVEALENIVKGILDKKREEEDFLNPPVFGGRK